MRIAYLDCFSGISGDMFLGALVDAGVSAELLRETVRTLNVGAELEISRVNRNGIAATKVDVIVRGVKDMPREEFQANKLEQSHEHRHVHVHTHEHKHSDGSVHTHEHGHAHSHEHTDDWAHQHADSEDVAVEDHHAHRRGHAHEFLPSSPKPAEDAHAHEHHHHRGLKEIREIIGRAGISESAKQQAIAIFQALGEAEAKVHGTDIEKIHFHEVGSEDAIVDVVCAAVGAEALTVDEWRCSPLNVGSGMVKCEHGMIPIPAPATLELLKGIPSYSEMVEKELVTPTGAAIVKTLVSRFETLGGLRAEKIAYGAGSRDIEGWSNVVRLVIGMSEAVEPRKETVDGAGESVSVIEANLDDMTPQVFGYVLDRLLEEGALDAFGTSVQMKKSRPGMVLTVLAKHDDVERLSNLIFAETTTIGLRTRREQRTTLERRWVTVETRWGKVRIKVANLNGKELNVAPEFEDCRKLAKEHGVALKAVMQEATQSFLLQKQATDRIK